MASASQVRGSVSTTLGACRARGGGRQRTGPRRTAAPAPPRCDPARRRQRREALLHRSALHGAVRRRASGEPRVEARRLRIGHGSTPPLVAGKPLSLQPGCVNVAFLQDGSHRTGPGGCSPTRRAARPGPARLPWRSPAPGRRSCRAARRARPPAAPGIDGIGVRRVDRDQHPAGGLGEQRDERVEQRRQRSTAAPRPPTRHASTSAWARPPSDRSWAPVSRPPSRGLGEQAGQPLLGGEVDRAAAGRRGGRAATCAHSLPPARPRVAPSSSTASPSRAKPLGTRRRDVVEHAEHADHRGRQDRRSPVWL